jgi:hypothetical protein
VLAPQPVRSPSADGPQTVSSPSMARINFAGAHKGCGCGIGVKQVNQFIRAVEVDPRHQGPTPHAIRSGLMYPACCAWYSSLSPSQKVRFCAT